MREKEGEGEKGEEERERWGEKEQRLPLQKWDGKRESSLEEAPPWKGGWGVGWGYSVVVEGYSTMHEAIH